MKDTALEHIWHQVPPDYYQQGVKKSLLQKFWHTKKLAKVHKLINESNQNPTSILDVGSASGWFLSQLSILYPKAKCSGVDVYKDAISYGKQIYSSLRLIHTDAHTLPLDNNSFDVVVCTEVLEHVEDPERVLQEIKRVLKPEGVAVIEMDTGNLLFRLVWYWWTNIRRGVWRDSHIHAFNTQKLESMIKKTGFSILRKEIFNCTMAVAFQLKKKK